LIDKNKLKEGTKAYDNLMMEIDALRKLSSEHIVRLYEPPQETIMPSKSGGKPVIVLVLELVTGGELFPYLELGAFPTNIARTYFLQLCKAMHHCHVNGIVHRDLKPENLLLDGSFTLKVTDFGLCKVTDAFTEEAILRTRCGTTTYMAPEVISGMGYKGSAYDVWSMGILLFIFIFGQPPIEVAKESCWWYKQLRLGRHDRFWTQHQKFNPSHAHAFEPQIMDLINRMLHPNPASRITIEQILTHPWARGPVESAMTLQGELTRRKTVIDRTKQAAKMKEAAARGGGDGAFDPFGRTTVRAAEEEGPLANKLPTDFMAVGSRLHDCYSDHSAASLAARLTAVFKEAGCEVKDKGDYKYKAKLMTKMGAMMKIVVEIFDVSPEDPGMYHMLKIDRRSGDIASFNEIMKVFQSNMGDMLIPNPSLTPTDSMLAEATEHVAAKTAAAPAAAGDELDDLSLDDEDDGPSGPATF
jgi:hypothetical protein